MSYFLEITFPSNTNQQLACDALDKISASYEVQDNKLIFNEELSYTENEIVHGLNGEVRKNAKQANKRY